LATGFIGVLTGGAATEIHLLHRRETECRRLNDLDFVVESFASIPESLAQDFLFHHVHPDAPEGKTLLQLIDQEQWLRIDLFRQFGTTLSRAEIMEGPLGSLKVISLEDLVARTTSLVVGNLRRGSVIDRKHARSFLRLAGLGDPAKLEMAWGDHRQSEAASFSEAVGLGATAIRSAPRIGDSGRVFSRGDPLSAMPGQGAFSAHPARFDRRYSWPRLT
jgi:hypothetical protein